MLAIYGGQHGFGWRDHEIVGAQIVSVPMSVALAQAGNARALFVGLYLGALALMALLLNLTPVLKPVITFSRLGDDVRLAPSLRGDHALATVLATDVVDSTARAAELGDEAWTKLLKRHHQAVRKEIARFQGAEINTAGDSFMIAFDAPGRAVRCAFAIHEAMKPLGLKIRAGVHAGECVVAAGSYSGIALHVAARVAAKAEAGQTLTTRTIKDLCIGCDVVFQSLGSVALKGLEDSWEICVALDGGREE
jgi:class 3 adenylate cyclase